MREVAVALALLHRDRGWFLQRRPLDSKHLPGLWEFPGGKVERGESPEEALARELQEELSWSPGRIQALEPLVHAYADRTVMLHPFLAEGPAQPRASLAWGWFTAEEARRLEIPEANAPLLAILDRPR